MATLGLSDLDCAECGAVIKGGIVVSCPGCLGVMHRVCWEEGKACPRPGCAAAEPVVLPREMSDKLVAKGPAPANRRPLVPQPVLPVFPQAGGGGEGETSLAKLATLAASLQPGGPAANPAASTLTGELLTLDARYATLTRQVDGAILSIVVGLGFIGVAAAALVIGSWSGMGPFVSAGGRGFLLGGLSGLGLTAFLFTRHQLGIIGRSKQELEDLGKLQEKVMEAYQEVTQVTSPPAEPGKEGEALAPPQT